MTSSLRELEAAAAVVYEHMTPTAQIRWPLLCERTGCDVWVKHENHTPIGAFKVRGGLVYLAELRRDEPDAVGVISATRGNHGQSLALAARVHGFPATVVVPEGNSVEKNAAMTAFGAELIVHGRDFDEALVFSRRLAEERGLHQVESFHPRLVRGCASGSLELLRAVADLHTVYVPIGLGSGICAMIAAREALHLRTEIVGVVAVKAPTYALSFAGREVVPTDAADTFADGMAVRKPHPDALDQIRAVVARPPPAHPSTAAACTPLSPASAASRSPLRAWASACRTRSAPSRARVRGARRTRAAESRPHRSPW